MAYRQMKHEVLSLLRKRELAEALDAIAALPARRVINPLFGLLYHGDPLVRWHAVTAMGKVVADLADREMEAARVIMRRLMWNLNDESGGIGWGSPEAMGEIMARNGQLAGEFSSILISYLDPDGNFLEHEGLQQGALWGIGRLAHARPPLASWAATFLPPFLASPLVELRGLAVWAAVPILTSELRKSILPLVSDKTQFGLFLNGQLVLKTVGELATSTIN